MQSKLNNMTLLLKNNAINFALAGIVYFFSIKELLK